MRSRSAAALFALLASIALAGAAAALVVHPDPDGSFADPDQPPPPGGDPGWDRFGSFGPGGAVYLGRNPAGEAWVLSVRHIGGPSAFVLDGFSHPTDGFVEFTNADGTVADLRAWRILGAPALPDLPNLVEIAQTTPLVGEETRLLAHGRPEGAYTCWNSFWAEIQSCEVSTRRGYKWGPGSFKRWGTNEVAPTSPGIDELKNALGVREEIFVTRFNETGTELEAQSTPGDSGGALFVWDGQAWALAGTALFIGSVPPDPTRPDALAVFETDVTLFADLAYYRQQILDGTGIVLPEPGGGLAIGMLALGWLARRRRGRRP